MDNIINEINTALDKQEFQKSHISPLLSDYIIGKALAHHTPKSLNCTWEIFEVMYTSRNLSVYKMGVLLNAVASSSMNDLGIGWADYQPLQAAVQEMAAKWKAIFLPISETIQEKHTNRKKLVGHA